MKEEAAFDHQRSSCWPTICITLLLLLVLFFLAKFLKGKDVKNRNINKFPPGGRGWPIIGDSINWYNSVASSHPPQFVEEQVQRYGKIFSCNLFGKWAVVSADPNFNRFVMQNEGKLFQSSYPKSFRDLVGKNGVITAQGEQQRKLHSIASNMMRLEKLKFYFLQDIQIVLRNTLNNLHDNQIIHLQDICRKVAINLMVNQLLGVSNESEVNEMSQQFSDFADGCLSIPINFPGFPFHTAMKARESIICKINKTIEIHRQQPCSGVGNGLLWRMLEEESLPDDAVADFIINLLFAGNETTAKTMLFAVYFLTQCPKAMKQLLFNFPIQEKRNWRSSPVFAPFGGGARFCPGAELARLQIALFLNYFVSTFRWNQLKEDRMSFFPSARLVNGFQIQLRRRISSDYERKMK